MRVPKLGQNNRLVVKKIPRNLIRKPSQFKVDFKFMDITGISKLDVLKNFIEWHSVPTFYRKPRTMKEFAKLFNVSVDTLTDWRKRKGFFEEVGTNFQLWRQYTPDVYWAMLQSAKKGNVAAMKLWMQVFEHFSEKVVYVERQKPIAEPTPEQKEQISNAITHIGLATIIQRNNQKEYKKE